MKRILTYSILLFLSVGCKKAKAPVLVNAQRGCAPITSDTVWYRSDNKAPFFEELGNLHFPITTRNEEAQRYFNQGLTLAYGFNHAEAARSFYYAARLDPESAMAYWGYAYVLGPNYNAGMEADNYQRAYKAVQTAKALATKRANDKEIGLIDALAKRYVKEPVEERYELDAAYSEAMGDLYKKFPNDPDIGTLYAESIMNLHPWDLYDKHTGTQKTYTHTVLTTLGCVLEKYPEHIGANHYYIHAVESSGTPEKGLKNADRFYDGLVPNAGHLVHMPSHIYLRTGAYHKGTLTNIKAIAVDSAYVTTCHAQGAYPLAYFPHNQHFLAATATLEGNSKWALYAATEVSRNANKQLMKEPGWGTLQHYYTIPYYVNVKFGKWDEILKMANEFPELDYPSAILHYAKGMAYLENGKLQEASNELEVLAEIAQNDALKEISIWDINSVYDLVQIAQNVLKAELLFKKGEIKESIVLYKKAVEIEDNLNYNEPPDWFFSVRHRLGSIQLISGLYEDAILSYNEDLEKYPKNGWALMGLINAYTKLDSIPKTEELKKKFADAWSTADVDLKSSVIR